MTGICRGQKQRGTYRLHTHAHFESVTVCLLSYVLYVCVSPVLRALRDSVSPVLRVCVSCLTCVCLLSYVCVSPVLRALRDSVSPVLRALRDSVSPVLRVDVDDGFLSFQSQLMLDCAFVLNTPKRATNTERLLLLFFLLPFFPHLLESWSPPVPLRRQLDVKQVIKRQSSSFCFLLLLLLLHALPLINNN